MPIRPARLPTTTRALKLKRLPPLTTFATRLTWTILSIYSVCSANSSATLAPSTWCVPTLRVRIATLYLAPQAQQLSPDRDRESHCDQTPPVAPHVAALFLRSFARPGSPRQHSPRVGQSPENPCSDLTRQPRHGWQYRQQLEHKYAWHCEKPRDAAVPGCL